MMSRNMVKSNASSVQPNHAAHQASHWSFVGSFHHGIVPAVAALVMAHPWAQAGSYNLASTVLSNKEIHWMSSSRGLTGYLGYDSFLDVLPPGSPTRTVACIGGSFPAYLLWIRR